MYRRSRKAGKYLRLEISIGAVRPGACHAAVFALTFSAACVRAESDPPTLPPVQVTASRVAQQADDALAAVSVITREQIERSQTQSLPELLRATPGLGVTGNGGPGKLAPIFLRGTNSDHVLVLIDGVRIGSATLGTAALQDIPLAQIDRVEVVRGPRSSLYGSEAIGGVIQIFTRRGGGPLRFDASLGAGSAGTYASSVGWSGGAGAGWYALSMNSLNTNGFDACRGKPSPAGAGCFTNEPDRDGYRSLSGSLRAGYRVGESTEIDVNWLRAEGRNEYDGSFTNEGTFLQDVLGARFRTKPFDSWHVTLAAGRSRDETDNFVNGRYRSSFDTRRDTVSLQNDFTVAGGHTLSLGVDYLNETVGGTTAYRISSRDNTGVFVQYLGESGPVQVQAALRQDDNQQFGRHGTGSAALGYRFGEALRASASYGTAFKAPTFNQLYFPDFGNPDLRPEESANLELGLDGRAAQANWSLRAYRNRITDLVSGFPVSNIASARIDGVEATLSAEVAGWMLATNLSLLDPQSRADDANRGKQLPRRARQLFNLEVDRNWGALRTGLTLHSEGRRFEDLANTVALGGFTTVDLRFETTLAPDWRLQARLANVFDKRYETAAFYNQPGREVMFTLRWQPK